MSASHLAHEARGRKKMRRIVIGILHSRALVLLAAAALVAIALMLVETKPAQAATFTVNNTNDSGFGSLRQAITDANNETS